MMASLSRFTKVAPDKPAVKKNVPAAALLQVVPHLVNLILFSDGVSVQVVFHCCLVLQSDWW